MWAKECLAVDVRGHDSSNSESERSLTAVDAR